LVSDLQQASYSFGLLNRPEDFDALGAQSSPNGYLGLVYADGDDMGHNLEEIDSVEELSRFARAVDEAVYGAVKQAILAHLKPGPKARSLPFDVLLLGGDDLIMVTTAQAAIETALTVLEQFPELTKQYCDKRLSLSVAVVLAHIKFPISSLVELAASALKFAKRERAKRRLTEGLLNFLVVSGTNHLDFGDYYNITLKAEYGNEMLHRTMRPYTAADMRRLIQAKRDLADAPRAKLEQLRSAVFQSKQQATLEGLVTLLRWRNDVQRQRIQQLVNEFAANQVVFFPWVQRDGNYYTPLLDLVELFDFVL
jgi:CRISPR/Cas system-associated protein Cas10 (large subunit of type III CRISPR-Cas system)